MYIFIYIVLCSYHFCSIYGNTVVNEVKWGRPIYCNYSVFVGYGNHPLNTCTLVHLLSIVSYNHHCSFILIVFN